MKTTIHNYIEQSNRKVLSREIERSFDISGQEVRKHIRQLRRDGIPLVGSRKGYYIAKNRKDLELLIEDLRKRAVSMLKTISELEKNREKKEYQSELF